MLAGFYNYVFGAENDAQESSSMGVCMRTRTKEDDGWLVVQESASGRSSPIMIAPPELLEIDQLSCTSFQSRREGGGGAVSPSVLRRTEAIKEARAVNRTRATLEKALFATDPAKSISASTTVIGADASKTSPSGKTSAGQIKRASTSVIVAAESKIKNRSKKAGKLLSGANNNRKCNNLA